MTEQTMPSADHDVASPSGRQLLAEDQIVVAELKRLKDELALATRERDRLRENRDALEHEYLKQGRAQDARLVEEQRDHAATLSELRDLVGISALIGQKLNGLQDTLERQRPVIEAARALVADWKANRSTSGSALVAAVDALPASKDEGQGGEQQAKSDEVDSREANTECRDAEADSGQNPEQKIDSESHAPRITPTGQCSHGISWAGMDNQHFAMEHKVDHP